MKNRTLNSIFSKGAVSARKVLTVLLAITLCVSLLVPQVSSGAATTAATGSLGGAATLYSPLDMLTSTGTLADIYNANGSDVWQFEVERQASENYDVLLELEDKDFFVETSEGFAAPTLNVKDDGVTVSWTAQTHTFDYYTVKFANLSATDAAEVTFEYKVKKESSSILVNDLIDGNRYYVQVVAGNKASALADFGNVGGSQVTSAECDVYVTTDESAAYANKALDSTYGWMGWLVDISPAIEKDILKTKGALVVKWDQTMVKEGIEIKYNNSTQTANNEKFAFLGDFNYQNVTPKQQDDESYIYEKDTTYGATVKTTTDKIIMASPELEYISSFNATMPNNKRFMQKEQAGFNQVGLADGYMIIPLSTIDDAFLADLNEGTTNNMLRFEMANMRFYKDGYESNGSVEADQGWVYNVAWDRTIKVESVTVVDNYAQYCKENNLVDPSEIGVIEGKTDLKHQISGTTVNYTKAGWTSSYSFATRAKAARYTNQMTSWTDAGITYKTAVGEKMMFGFKAPEDGVYEFSAPIAVTEGITYSYAVSKVNADGTKVYLNKWTSEDGLGATAGVIDLGEYSKDCTVQSDLKAGDTIYLELYAAETAASAFIGLPTAKKINYATNDEDKEVYTYRASDYFFNYQVKELDKTKKTGINGYSDIGSNACVYAIPITTGAWEYGYYSPEISSTNDLSQITIEDVDPYGFDTAVVGETIEDEISVIYQRYKLATRRDGAWAYLPYENTHSIKGTVSGAGAALYGGNLQQVVGAFTLDGTFAKMETTNDDVVDMRYNNGYAASSAATLPSYSFFAILKYTAPISGTANLTHTGNLYGNNGGWKAKAVVIKGDEVVAVQTGAAQTVEVEMLAGEELYVVYTNDWGNTIDVTQQTNRKSSTNIGVPVVTMVKDKEHVDFNTDGGYAIAAPEAEDVGFVNTPVNAENTITLPTANKVAAVLKNWNDGTADVEVGTEVSAKATYKANWLYLGDADANNTIGDAEDIKGIRAAVLTDDQDKPVVNLNGDDVTDIRDLLRIKKYNEGIAGIRN